MDFCSMYVQEIFIWSLIFSSALFQKLSNNLLNRYTINIISYMLLILQF